MEEAFLQFIWQFQCFDKKGLKTTSGETLEIIKTGMPNHNAGPDFLNAHIVIDGIEWFGHIEIHNQGSDWYKHRHETNPSYDNVILHVVYENDVSALRSEKTTVPTVEVGERIDYSIYKTYKELINSISSVPCSYHLTEVPAQIKIGMLDNVLIQRLEGKGRLVLKLLKENKNDWEETAYQYLARNFGFKVNGDTFHDLSKALPYKIIKKHSDNLLQIEALLFGMANLIPSDSIDDYSRLLKREYSFLSHKYSLSGNELNKGRWKFLRLRPANFPTIRLSQFAAVLASVPNLFSSLIEIKNIDEAKHLLNKPPSGYWQKHYNFNKISSTANHKIGQDSLENIIINTVCQLLAAYRLERDEPEHLDRAIYLLENVKAEENKITRQYNSKAFVIKNAMDSQAIIELYNNYCSQRNCLNCQIGVSIIREPKAVYKKSLKSEV